MKNQKILIQILVIVALLGFVASSIYLFYLTLKGGDETSLSAALIYVTSALTGLVGGIVASSFGVKLPNDGNGVQAKKDSNFKFHSLGTYAASESSSDKSKENIGFMYALAYILVGFGAVGIWIFMGDTTFKSVSSMASTFLGMLIPIVAQYFNRQ